jgi:hypothetical protein
MILNITESLASTELDTDKVELLLGSCAEQASIVSLINITRGYLSCYNLRKYLFYLIECATISYEGEKGVYAITAEGWKLLYMIKKIKNAPSPKCKYDDIIIYF